MNDKDRRELKTLINAEIKKRGDSIVSNKTIDFRLFKIIRNVTLLIVTILAIINYLMPLLNIELFNKDWHKFTTVSIVSLSAFAGFLFYLTSTYNKKNKLSKEKWFHKTGFKAIILFIIAYIIIIILGIKTLPPSPTRSLIGTFCLVSCLGYYLFVFTITFFPQLFLNQMLTRIATFFRISILISSLEFLLLNYLTGLAKDNVISESVLLNPGLFQYFGWILGMFIIQMFYFDLKNIGSDDKLDMAQLHILSFYDPILIINTLKKTSSIRKSEIEALELFLSLEKDGDEYKERALLIFLRNKYGKKAKGIGIIFVSIIGFVFLTIIGGLIELWTINPVDNWLKELWNRVF